MGQKNKFIKIIVLIVVFVLLIFSYSQIRSYFFISKGNSLFMKGQYEEAIDFFKKDNTLIGMYNSANAYYKMGNWSDAIERYQLTESGLDNDKKLSLYYNLGNAFYRYGIVDESQREKSWNNAIDMYVKALGFKDDEDARYNLDVVRKELNKMKQLQDKKQSNNKNNGINNVDNKNSNNRDNKSNGDDKNKNSISKSSIDNGSGNSISSDGDNIKNKKEGGGSIKEQGDRKNNGNINDVNKNDEGINGNRGSNVDKQNKNLKDDGKSINNGENDKNSVNVLQNISDLKHKLSEEQNQAIENYKKQLIQNQREYGQYYNKRYHKKSSDLFDIFFSDPFFGNGVSSNNNEKNW